jgi:hypothetical protein
MTKSHGNGKRQPPAPRPLPETALVCNCAGCTLELAVDPNVASRCGVEALAGRVDGRPYCKTCLPTFRAP